MHNFCNFSLKLFSDVAEKDLPLLLFQMLILCSSHCEWAFIVAGPTAWNSLPTDVRSINSNQLRVKNVDADCYIYASCAMVAELLLIGACRIFMCSTDFSLLVPW